MNKIKPEKRYCVVSDLPEFTVFDRKQERDLFSTTTGNRSYACNSGCSEDDANMIADALNKIDDFNAFLPDSSEIYGIMQDVIINHMGRHIDLNIKIAEEIHKRITEGS